jgi:ParB/RepB/Spo0J family partition protein
MAAATEQPELQAVETIALEQIHTGANVRRKLENLDSLAASIRRHGILTAVTVTRRDGGGFDLVAGFRRVSAAAMAGLTSVPAVIRSDAGEAEHLRRQLAENLDREGLPDLDQGKAIQQLLDLGVAPEEVAETVQTTPENVQAWAQLLKLPYKVRRLIDSGRMTAAQAYPLVSLLDDRAAMRAALDHIDDGYPVDRAVTVVRQDREREQALTAARERLEAEGCPVVDAPQYGWFSSKSKMQRLGKGSGEVRIPVRKHAKMPCHAAYVSPHHGTVVYVCTDRKAHAGVEGSGVPDLRAERAARRATAKALKEAHVCRFGRLRDAIRGGAVDHDLAISHILRLSIGDADRKAQALAAAILELPVPEDGFRAERDALLAHAGASRENLTDVALAVAVARGENAMTADRFDWRSEVVAEHARLIRLARLHEFTSLEEALISQKSPVTSDQEDPAPADLAAA